MSGTPPSAEPAFQTLPDFSRGWGRTDWLGALRSDDVLTTEPGAEVVRHQPGCWVSRHLLSDGRVVFKKTYHRTFRLLLKGWLRLNPPILDGIREFENIRRLRKLGISTPVPIAAACDAGGRSFCITAEVTGARPLDRVWVDDGPDAMRDREVCRSLARLVRCLHEARIAHRDLYLCHIWLRSDGSGSNLVLMDLERAEPRKRFWRRWKVKDLAALEYSAREIDLPVRLRLRFFRLYLGEERIDRSLLRAVLRKADRIARHGRKG